jgi:uncharacterized protein
VTDTTETNRRFLRALFSTIASEGWADGFMAALHDDLVFNAMGTSPVAGRYQGKQVYRTQVLDRLHTRLASWPMPIVDTMIVDGNGPYKSVMLVFGFVPPRLCGLAYDFVQIVW